MKIRINKKAVSFLLASTLSFSLCSCQKDDTNYDDVPLTDVISEVQDYSLVDEVFNTRTVKDIDVITGEVSNMSLMYNAIKLEELLNKCSKVKDIEGLKLIPDDSDAYYLVEDASTWDDDYIDDLLYNIEYNDDAMKQFSIGRLNYYVTYLNKELKENGYQEAYDLLSNSIKSTILEAENADVSDYNLINIDNNAILYDGSRLEFYNDDAMLYLSNLDNIIRNEDEFDSLMSFSDGYNLCRNVLNLSKDIIYKGGRLSNDEVKPKSLFL